MNEKANDKSTGSPPKPPIDILNNHEHRQLAPTDRLSSWKEIAQFIARDERTAMRWEEQGMPVNRIPGGKRSRVSASRKEISQWMSGKPAEPSLEVPLIGLPNSDDSSIPARRTTPVSRRVLLGLSAAAIPVAGVASFLVLHRKPEPERAVASGNLLTVLDGLGRTVWTRRLPGTPRYNTTDPWQVQVLDFEGHGRRGVLVAQNFVPAPGADQTGQGELFYFDADGNLKWTLPARPALLDFDGHSFEPAWNYGHVIVTPSRGGSTIWAAVRHCFRWPGCVLRVDLKGKARVHFANAGNVERLAYLHRADGDFIAFSGENNAFNRSCAGLVGIDDPPAVSPPSALPSYRFANGPAGVARSYILFPTVELDTARGAPYGHGEEVFLHGGEVVVVAGSGLAYLQYQLSEKFEPLGVIPSGSYPNIHRRFEEQGVLKHTWEECPELKKPLVLRRFVPGVGWRDDNIPWRLPSNIA